VCVIAPDAAAEATLMTCIWAAARVAVIGSAMKYFIMNKLRIVQIGRKGA
jgi:hypothetical protein